MGDSPSILALDDDEAVLQLLREAFSDQYQLHTAADIRHATDFISAHHFDLIIADLNNPDVDDLELLRIIRAKFDRTPLFVISPYPNLAEQLGDVRVEACLPKPFSVNVLSAVVRTLCRRALLPHPVFVAGHAT